MLITEIHSEEAELRCSQKMLIKQEVMAWEDKLGNL